MVQETVQPQLTQAELKAALEQGKLQRQQECAKAIAQVLESYNCELSAQVVLRQNSVAAQVLLLVKD
jgi:hypothetical protein